MSKQDGDALFQGTIGEDLLPFATIFDRLLPPRDG